MTTLCFGCFFGSGLVICRTLLSIDTCGMLYTSATPMMIAYHAGCVCTLCTTCDFLCVIGFPAVVVLLVLPVHLFGYSTACWLRIPAVDFRAKIALWCFHCALARYVLMLCSCSCSAPCCAVAGAKVVRGCCIQHLGWPTLVAMVLRLYCRCSNLL